MPVSKRLTACLFTSMLATAAAPAQTAIIPSESAFHGWAATPPMGWNSWDCFGTINFMVFTSEPAGLPPPDQAPVAVQLKDLGLDGAFKVTDLWTGKQVDIFTGEFAPVIRRHGAGLYRISGGKK